MVSLRGKHLIIEDYQPKLTRNAHAREGERSEADRKKCEPAKPNQQRGMGGNQPGKWTGGGTRVGPLTRIYRSSGKRRGMGAKVATRSCGRENADGGSKWTK